MSILLNLHQPPFSFLAPEQLEYLVRALVPNAYSAGDSILLPGQVAPGLYIVSQGVVEELDADDQQLLSQYGPDDIFDVRSALNTNPCKNLYRAVDDTKCYVLKSADFHFLLDNCADFAQYFRTDLGSRQLLLDQHEGSGVSEFLLGHIDGDCIRPPIYVTGQTSLAKVASIMDEHQCQSVLVRTFKNTGIVTNSDLVKATLIDDKPRNSRVADIATFNLVNVNYGDFIFNALLKMIHHDLDRIVVSRDGDIVGTLELVDVLGLFATQSHMVAMRIEHATSVADLKETVNSVDILLSDLNRKGVNVIAIMELMTTLHRRLMQRAFELVFPAHLHNSVCILALGTEGRGEHVLKPGQDNAIIVADEFQRDEILVFLKKWHDLLCGLGYPRKDNSAIFNNASWVNTLEGWQRRLQRWQQLPDKDSVMDLSIFMDAQPICGDADLFTQLNKSLWNRDNQSQVLATIMAAPALRYEMPLTFLGNLREHNGTIDIRKGGILPIVQGVRALAFENGIVVTNTLARLDQLQHLQVIKPDYAQSIKDTLLLLFRIRLRYQLESSNDRDESKIIKVDMLRSAEREMLRYALHRVKRFKLYLADHFRLTL